jgi:hypothetical protein
LTGTSSADTIESTTDAVTFASRGKTGLTTAGNGVCFGTNYSAWVFVGSGTSVIYSESSSTGALLGKSNPFTTQGNRCAARNFISTTFSLSAGPTVLADFVMVGSGEASLAYSINGGRTFTPVGLLSLGVAFDVAYSRTQQLWVAYGKSAGMTSGDGITWATNGAIPTNFVSNVLGAIARSDEQNLWVIGLNTGGGSPSLIYTSPDTVTWTSRMQVNGINSGALGDAPSSIAYSPTRNIWVVVTFAGGIAYSTTATGTWTQATPGQGTTVWRRVTWMPELGFFLASGQGGGTGTPTSATSYDGIAWSAELNAFQPGSTMNMAIWNGTMMYAVGSSATDTVMSSTDGITFTSLGSPFLTATATDLCYGAEYNRWVFAGTGTTSVVTMPTATGIVTRTNPFSTAGGRCAAKFTIAPNPVVPSAPSYNADFVVMGTGTIASLAYSLTGGRTFIPAGKLFFATSGNDVAYSQNQSKWIAVGTGTSGGMSSNDGVSWISIFSLNSVAGSSVFGIARSESQNLWVVGGSGTNKIATSSDGVTWTGRSTPFALQVNGIAYSKTLALWVAVGSGTSAIASSPDGITWTQRMAYTNSIAGQHVIWASELGLFFVSLSGSISSGASAATSPDGITWTTSSLVFEPAASTFGAAWNGTFMYLAGLSSLNTLASSTDGLSFVGQGNTLFTITGKGVCYGADYSRWLLLGGSTNTGYTFPISGTPAITHHLFSVTGNRCTARYTNATT